ncbi:MAG: nitrophenyl compound nitroreductase subunit ArsF family protein [Candidatus Omnitrophota bacterium]
MKKIFILSLLLILALPVFGQKPSPVRVIAYYFHGNFRCTTCHKLEQYSKEAIEQNFKNELSSGKLEFKAINVDEKANEHFVNDYQLYTKSLILVLIKDDKQVKYKNLDKIWEYVGDEKKFFEYVIKEIRDFLKDS